jgi:hypothetical protein
MKENGRLMAMEAPQISMKSRRCLQRRSVAVIVSLAIVVIGGSVVGCNKVNRPLAPLRGKVTFNGKPLRFGGVMIEHDSGQPATGAIQSDGTFTMITDREGEGAVVGKHRVRVGCYEGQDPTKQLPGVERSIGKLLIPARYTAFETSGLSVEVRPGENEPLLLNLAP